MKSWSLIVAVLLLLGCDGKKADSTGSTNPEQKSSTQRTMVKGRPSHLVLAEQGYFPQHLPVCEDYVSSSVICPGDLSGDGVPDVIASFTEQGAGSAVDRGTICAISGADGSSLWSIKGKSNTEDSHGGYQFLHISGLPDMDGDGRQDFLALDSWYKSRFYVMNAADGGMMSRHDGQRLNVYQTLPLVVQNVDSTSEPEFLFRSPTGLSLRIYSLADSNEVIKSPEVGNLELHQKGVWVSRSWADEDNDQLPEKLCRTSLTKTGQYTYHVLSGKKLNILRSFHVEVPKRNEVYLVGSRLHVHAGDIDQDQVPDLAYVCSMEGGEDGRASVVTAVSTATGNKLWQFAGTELPGGAKSFTVEAGSREKVHGKPDVEFGKAVLSIPDLDGDLVPELAATGFVEGMKTGIYLFSGKTGAHLQTFAPEKAGWYFSESHMVLLPNCPSSARSFTIVAAGFLMDGAKKKPAIFFL